MPEGSPGKPGAPVAVVGGRGYLGRHLSVLLNEHVCGFWVVGRQPLPEAPPFPYRSSVPDLRASVAGAGTVVHLATLTTPSVGESDRHLDVENVQFTVDLIEACVQEKVRHLIFSSSGGTIYGDTGDRPARESDPVSPSCSYAVGKLAGEHYFRLAAQARGLKVTVLRISNTYGGSQMTKGRQGVVSYLLGRLEEDKEITLLGDTIRDYVHIEDVARAFDLAIRHPPEGYEIYNISTGIGTKLVDLATRLHELWGKAPALKVGEKRTFDLSYSVLDNSKVRTGLNWAPEISLDEGLRRCVAEFRDRQA